MIPKIIHQLWLGEETVEVKLFHERIKRLHPSWSVILWGARQRLPELHNQRLIDNLSGMQAKSDVIRMELLGKYGGVWLDADIFVFRPIDTLILKEYEFMISSWWSDLYGITFDNYFIASIPNHPICSRYNSDIQNTPEFISGDVPTNPSLLFNLTGGPRIVKCVMETKEQLVTIPRKLLGTWALDPSNPSLEEMAKTKYGTHVSFMGSSEDGIVRRHSPELWRQMESL